jgi:hypothetical protein
MKTLYLLSLVIGFSSVSLIASDKTLSSTPVAQLDNITNVTTSVLDKLGYECDTASAAGIICRKCSEQNSVTEKCTAYICDSVTKKCRKKEATLPKLPNSERDGNESPLPSLPNL